ncbi:hypothetical protein BEQ56_08565 [Anaerolineaceae bacterium oral taxon 439]|nr:hypothetical protein BEQ56_08565 [Anaerolineaceae bacterium oral taxon 439]
MMHVLLASHGSYASGLREAAEMILGNQEKLYVLGLYPGESLEIFTEKISRVIQETGEAENVLILTDLRNGTPFNAALMSVVKYGSACISGVNLPLLLEVLSTRKECDSAEVVKNAIQSGKDGIVDNVSFGIQKSKSME